jgi:hypothetical protein
MMSSTADLRCGRIALEAETARRETGSVAWYKSLRVSLRQDCATAGAVNSYAEREGVDAPKTTGA